MDVCIGLASSPTHHPSHLFRAVDHLSKTHNMASTCPCRVSSVLPFFPVNMIPGLELPISQLYCLPLPWPVLLIFLLLNLTLLEPLSLKTSAK